MANVPTVIRRLTDPATLRLVQPASFPLWIAVLGALKAKTR